MPLSDLQIAEVAHETISVHERMVSGGAPLAAWPDMHPLYKSMMLSGVVFLRNGNPLDGPSALYEHMRGFSSYPWAHFDDAPLRIQERIFLFRAIVTALTGWTDAPYPKAINGIEHLQGEDVPVLKW